LKDKESGLPDGTTSDSEKKTSPKRGKKFPLRRANRCFIEARGGKAINNNAKEIRNNEGQKKWAENLKRPVLQGLKLRVKKQVSSWRTKNETKNEQHKINSLNAQRCFACDEGRENLGRVLAYFTERT